MNTHFNIGIYLPVLDVFIPYDDKDLIKNEMFELGLKDPFVWYSYMKGDIMTYTVIMNDDI